MNRTLTPNEIARYGRHLTLPEVGMEGQQRLRDAAVLLVGAGGLGSPLGLYLAAAGVGRIGLVDFDRVELSNLQRQILYGTADVGQPKLDVARRRLEDLNPHVAIETHDTRLEASNARSILKGYDVIVDGTDNFPTRYLVNDACVLLGKPNVYGSIFRFEGQVSVFDARRGPCYRCLYPEPPAPGDVPNCAEGGVLGVLPAVVGALQANETIKWILGAGEPLLGRLLLFDALEMRFRELRLRKDPDCALCGPRATVRELTDEAAACAPAPAAVEDGHEIGGRSLKARLDGGDSPLLLDVRTPQEWSICRLDGATHVPLGELTGRVGEIDSEREIVVYCRSGQRSAMAVGFLLNQGYRRVRNLTGGLVAWATEIDPSLPRY
jgi:adenylyltransferase/sulfurtransferase